MQLTVSLAIAVLLVGAAHLFIAGRALLDPSWLHAIVLDGAGDTDTPIAEWEQALVFVLAVLSLIGTLAVACGVGLLRRLNIARRAWIAIAVALAVLYGYAFILYVQYGVVWCASLAGIVTVVALWSLAYLPRQRVREAFR